MGLHTDCWWVNLLENSHLEGQETERRTWLVGTSCFIFGRSRDQISVRRRLSWLRVFVVFSFSPGKCRNSTYLKIGHDRFQSYPFQLINHLIIRRYIIWPAGSVIRRRRWIDNINLTRLAYDPSKLTGMNLNDWCFQVRVYNGCCAGLRNINSKALNINSA
jgi:hypothetical protein